MTSFFWETALALAGIAIGIAVPILKKPHQKIIAAIASGLVLLFVAVWVGYEIGSRRPAISPSSIGDAVPFVLTSDSNEINPALKWQQGESRTSSYEVGQRPLIITAGSWTNQYSNVSTAPMVMYPIKGDFDAQITLVFHPMGDQYAGIGVRSTVNSYTWLRVTRARNGQEDVVIFSTNDNGEFAYRDEVKYSGDIVYLRIVRQGNLFQMFYSSDGNAWNPIGKAEIELPDEVEIYLLALSVSGDIAIARFQDLKVIH